jgi:Magnesium chelatase, subunit ChlI
MGRQKAPLIPALEELAAFDRDLAPGFRLLDPLGREIEASTPPDHHAADDDPRGGLWTTRMHRVAGLTGDRPALVTTRPFRAPHHTLSGAGLIGGGQVPMPGEVSLAHHGILFLDELPAFKRHVLAGLRQPLKMGVTQIHLLDILALAALAARVVSVQTAVPQRLSGM